MADSRVLSPARLTDQFGRAITYLRISVTDRCNLRCYYCMGERTRFLGREQLLTPEEIVGVAQAAVTMGITKMRLTGGEPLMRRDITELVRALSQIEGIEDLALTTNGTLLVEHAQALADAGLDRVNVSLDTVDPARFLDLTGGGDVRQVLRGIEAALKAGLTPVKINCVVGERHTAEDLRSVQAFGRRRGLEVRPIQRIDLAAGVFSHVKGSGGGDCGNCNRLRLSSDGAIRPCLLSDLSFSVRQLGGAEAIRRAVAEKPERGRPCTHDWMHGIGG
jgi:cyclic pyranopterin phosphate synthase